jgi:hypothetical protein
MEDLQLLWMPIGLALILGFLIVVFGVTGMLHG